MKNVSYFIGAGLAICLYFACTEIDRSRTEIARLSGNVSALTAENRHYVDALGDSAVEKRAIIAERDELRELCDRLANKVEALGVRPKDVTSATETTTSTEIKEAVAVKETGDSVMYAEYRDLHNFISCAMRRDSAKFESRSVDTITGVMHVTRKRFLFFRLNKVKSTQYVVSNKNKRSTVVPNIVVVLK